VQAAEIKEITTFKQAAKTDK